ncbi:MAG: nuclear transport factor 2 family protein [Bacteroidota bacterium]
MLNLSEKITDLNDLVLQGKVLEAFEKYYDDQVHMQENEAEPTVGKAANRKREEAFMANLVEFREAKPLKVAVGTGTTMVEWYYDFTHKEWGIRNYTQVSVQTWKDGKIVKEKFYYST